MTLRFIFKIIIISLINVSMLGTMFRVKLIFSNLIKKIKNDEHYKSNEKL